MLLNPYASVFDEACEAFRLRTRAVTITWPQEEVQAWERNGHLPKAVFRDLGGAGCFEQRWNAGRLGGVPLGLVLVQETSAVSGGLGLAVSIHSEVFMNVLSARARTAWQKEVLADATTGAAVGCVAATEPRGGSDLAGVTTRAHRLRSGWRIVGEKRFITNAGRATHALVLAGIGGDSGVTPSVFLVPLDAAGVDVVGFFQTLGVCDADTAAIQFDVVVPDDAHLTASATGMLHMMRALQHERLAASMQLLTAARTSLGLATSYCRVRTQFGSRLIDHQAIRHRLADAATKLLAAESTFAIVVNDMRSGMHVDREICALKLLCAKTANEIVDESLQFLEDAGTPATTLLSGTSAMSASLG